jgi:hypothetical protein
MKKLIIVLSLFSCSKQIPSQYQIFNFSKNGIKIIGIDVYNISDESKLDGFWEIKDAGNLMLESGNFEHGFKVGDWSYHLDDNPNLTINWKVYNDSTFKLSNPSNWEIIDQTNFRYCAIPPTNSNFRSNKFFGIFEYKIQNNSTEALDSFWIENVKKIFANKDFRSASFSQVLVDGKKYYFTRIEKNVNNERIIVLDLVGALSDNIYEFTYSDLYENIEKKHLEFFELIRNTEIKEKRFFKSITNKVEFINIDSTAIKIKRVKP